MSDEANSKKRSQSSSELSPEELKPTTQPGQITEPVLIDVPLNIDTTSAVQIGDLFSGNSLATTLSKVAALEAFIAATIRDSTFNEFMNDLLVNVIQVVKSEAGSIFEVDPFTNILFFRSSVGSSSDRVVSFTVPMGQGIVGHVAESKQPIVVDNVPENRIHLKSIEKVIGFETRNIVALPILVRGKVFGVLELLNRVGESNYTPEDVELLKYLCGILAKVIEIRLMIAWSKNEHMKESSSNNGGIKGEAA